MEGMIESFNEQTDSCRVKFDESPKKSEAVALKFLHLL